MNSYQNSRLLKKTIKFQFLINVNYEYLPDAIEKLETQGLPLATIIEVNKKIF